MKNEAIGLVLTEIHNKTNLTEIALKLSNEFNSKYGIQWFTIIGNNGYVSQLETEPNTLLWFSYSITANNAFKPASN